jgi:hypothetical protein
MTSGTATDYYVTRTYTFLLHLKTVKMLSGLVLEIKVYIRYRHIPENIYNMTYIFVEGIYITIRQKVYI